MTALSNSFHWNGQPHYNLRSYPPSLYFGAGKEGMIHLLVGSYVQKPDSGFFLWLVEKQYLRFVVCCLLISCHILTRLPARSRSENRMVQTKRVFARTSFLFKPRRISILTLWRQSVVQVKMFWPLSSLSGFLENYKGGWNVSELFTKRKQR